ncbi:axoneme-associated protein mst101 [Strigomonas culicis]|uniref:Axoneme-associated protein mst101 n=1 Tax=Strigomonas culicis TaxID=28005 RepID=S9V172_9TRYP|nr:axoneme-associated protein mst101 [Strigomonas culicis]|eukprot:EPY16545.1 axoneme-associated protein mst101 [Strigomonas culicis]
MTPRRLEKQVHLYKNAKTFMLSKNVARDLPYRANVFVIAKQDRWTDAHVRDVHQRPIAFSAALPAANPARPDADLYALLHQKENIVFQDLTDAADARSGYTLLRPEAYLHRGTEAGPEGVVTVVEENYDYATARGRTEAARGAEEAARQAQKRRATAPKDFAAFDDDFDGWADDEDDVLHPQSNAERAAGLIPIDHRLPTVFCFLTGFSREMAARQSHYLDFYHNKQERTHVVLLDKAQSRRCRQQNPLAPLRALLPPGAHKRRPPHTHTMPSDDTVRPPQGTHEAPAEPRRSPLAAAKHMISRLRTSDESAETLHPSDAYSTAASGGAILKKDGVHAHPPKAEEAEEAESAMPNMFFSSFLYGMQDSDALAAPLRRSREPAAAATAAATPQKKSFSLASMASHLESRRILQPHDSTAAAATAPAAAAMEDAPPLKGGDHEHAPEVAPPTLAPHRPAPARARRTEPATPKRAFIMSKVLNKDKEAEKIKLFDPALFRDYKQQHAQPFGGGDVPLFPRGDAAAARRADANVSQPNKNLITFAEYFEKEVKPKVMTPQMIKNRNTYIRYLQNKLTRRRRKGRKGSSSGAGARRGKRPSKDGGDFEILTEEEIVRREREILNAILFERKRRDALAHKERRAQRELRRRREIAKSKQKTNRLLKMQKKLAKRIRHLHQRKRRTAVVVKKSKLEQMKKSKAAAKHKKKSKKGATTRKHDAKGKKTATTVGKGRLHPKRHGKWKASAKHVQKHKKKKSAATAAAPSSSRMHKAKKSTAVSTQKKASLKHVVGKHNSKSHSISKRHVKNAGSFKKKSSHTSEAHTKSKKVVSAKKKIRSTIKKHKSKPIKSSAPSTLKIRANKSKKKKK